MSPTQRVALFAGALVVAVAAFLIVRPSDDETTDGQPAPAPKPDVTRIRLAVTSEVADEVHVHGYDLSKPVSP